ncbi:MAG: hypothetical protein IT193_05520 [Propionibacteriaceae bacterium]|nr:hypothetical protein [Propionibacteriaceae bacterium]
MPVWSAEALALVCLAAVLAFAVIRPRGLPEGVAAVPVTALVVARDRDRTRLGPQSPGRHTRFVIDHAPGTVALQGPGETPGLDSVPPPPTDR